MTRIPVLATAVFLLTSTASAGAQEQPAAGFEGLVEVTEVLLDVLAVDKSGEVALGLGKEDFEVEENGEAMEISGVSFYATRYGHDGSLLAADGSIPSSRYFVLFFHRQGWGGTIGNYHSRQQLKARGAALSWVEEHLLPSDWVAVAGYDVRLKLYQDFTQDREALAEGIRNAISGKNPEKDLGRGGRRKPPSGAASLLRHLPEGKALRKETRTMYDSVRLVAEAAGYQVGRKNLMIFTTGFGEFDSSRQIPEWDHRLYPQMEHALNDHNVAVYPIDMTPTEIMNFQGALLRELALDTGGLYFRDRISFLTPMRQISADNAGYYLVGYQSEHPADEAGYQKVQVRARDKSIKLRARRGYRYGVE
ncbi:MAG: VWA domain-containing protein [bacterium]|nr:VWA domain-containing protein [bacterium]